MYSTRERDRSRSATLAITFGCIGLLAWFIPIIGYPIAIAGIVFGVKGFDKARGAMGLVLCILCLLASTVNGYIGYQNTTHNRQTSAESSTSSSTIGRQAVATTVITTDDIITYEANFINSCENSGGAESSCQCALNVTEEMYTYEERMNYEAQGSYPSELTTAVTDRCA